MLKFYRLPILPSVLDWNFLTVSTPIKKLKAMKTLRLSFHILAILLVLILAWNLRIQATQALPPDSDEGIYLDNAVQFAHLIQSSDWAGFLETNPNPEHPPLSKILFGWAILPAFERDMQSGDLYQAVLSPTGFNARRAAAVFGALAAGLLAWFNPIGGFFLAVHTMTVKYTSEIMLEGLPSFTSLASVLCYTAYKRNKSPRNLWWFASAIFLGLTASGKFIYALVGFAILIDWLFEMRKPGTWKIILAWGLLSLTAFIASNPYLWPNPPGRLFEALTYHSRYSTSAQEVLENAFPVYQPFIWLATSAADWHPGIFTISIDLAIIGLAVLGLVRLWKKERVFVLWLLVGIIFLLAWPTKWPQYILVLTAPLSLAAGEALLILFKEIWNDLLALRKSSA